MKSRENRENELAKIPQDVKDATYKTAREVLQTLDKNTTPIEKIMKALKEKLSARGITLTALLENRMKKRI